MICMNMAGERPGGCVSVDCILMDDNNDNNNDNNNNNNSHHHVSIICLYICIYVAYTSRCVYTALRKGQFIGWSNNHFNNLHFRKSPETKKNTRDGNGKFIDC